MGLSDNQPSSNEEKFQWTEMKHEKTDDGGWMYTSIKLFAPSDKQRRLRLQCKEVILYDTNKRISGGEKGNGILVIPAHMEILVYEAWYKDA